MIAMLAAMVFAPSLAPHGLGCGDTYTITSILKVLRPCEPAVITDAYQDVQVLSDDGKCFTLSVTYFPLNDSVRRERIGRYSAVPGELQKYLRPTVTCNWDAGMRERLVHDLETDGITPSKLKPGELVARVASWVFRTSQFGTNSDAMPCDWFVSFIRGKPVVDPTLQAAFQQSKANRNWSAQEAFAHELFGRQMFSLRTHGACTSSSIYLATVLRALGIPTRILSFIPPCDGNDPHQIDMVSSGITRAATRQKVLDGVPRNAGFANHMFNEVWIDGKWVRLNYDRLGQDVVDPNYLGLMTHIDTCADISEAHLAESWGLRASRWPQVNPKLSSVNPYQLLAIADHWGGSSRRDNPPVRVLTVATVNGVLWPGSPGFKALVREGAGLPKTELFLTIQEWDPERNYVQLREFVRAADPRLVLRSSGRPEVGIRYNGLNCNNSEVRGFGMVYDDPNGPRPVPGVTYTLWPLNADAQNHWKVVKGLQLVVPRR